MIEDRIGLQRFEQFTQCAANPTTTTNSVVQDNEVRTIAGSSSGSVVMHDANARLSQADYGRGKCDVWLDCVWRGAGRGVADRGDDIVRRTSSRRLDRIDSTYPTMLDAERRHVALGESLTQRGSGTTLLSAMEHEA